MRIAYLANIGNRDVTCDGKNASETGQKPRNAGEAWLQKYEALKERLDAPILLPGLRSVAQYTPALQVVLFYTDQEDPKHRESDTLHFATILQHLLPTRLEPVKAEVILKRIEGNPTNHDNLFSFFREQLPQTLPANTVDQVFVAPVGGIPAANMILLIHAIRLYGERCQTLYVTPDGQTHERSLHLELLREYARVEARAHLNRGDYAALGATLRRARLGELWHADLCDYADARTRFDFSQADNALQQAIRHASGTMRLRLDAVRRSFQSVLDPPGKEKAPTSNSPQQDWEAWFDLQRRLLGELFFNLRRKQQQGEWVDFIGRLFRLQEALLRLVFETHTRHSTDKIDKGHPDFVKAVLQDPGLHACLKQKDQWRDPDGCNSPTIVNLAKALSYWAETEPDLAKIKKAYHSINWQKLGELRNKSILAHGYEGIGETQMATQAGKKAPVPVDELVGHVEALLNAVGVSLGEDPYDTMNRLLEEALVEGDMRTG
jgi:hypothetical protein